MPAARTRLIRRCCQILDIRSGQSSLSEGLEALAVETHERAKGGFAEPQSSFKHRVEHRREVTGRGIDDLQYLGGRSLLFQSVARLGQQPRILHCDDRLRREVLQQRNLLVGEGADLLAIGRDKA